MDNKILISIKDYDYIFSDFDIRPYSERSISVDLREELIHRIKGVDNLNKIIFTLPKGQRSLKKEFLIRQRLRTSFKRRMHRAKERRKAAVIKGATYFIGGFLAYFALLSFATGTIIYDFALFPSWYLAWRGLDVLLSTKKYHETLNYYKRLDKADILFEDVEQYNGANQ